MKRWSLSIALTVIYLGIFHAWMHLPRGAIAASGIITFGCLVLWMNGQRDYFANDMDYWAHIIVAADIFLEGFLDYWVPLLVVLNISPPGTTAPTVHDHYGFYYCAIAFAGVIGAYRWREFSRASNTE